MSAPALRARRLHDVVVDRPRLLLVGINPGLRSGALGHHFAGRGNPFWRLLAASRLTPVLLDYSRRSAAGRVRHRADQPLPAHHANRRRADARRDRARPRGARAQDRALETRGRRASSASACTRCSSGARPAAAPGAKPETIAGARVFVVPNPSGLNASYPGFAHKLVWFKKLRALSRSPEPSRDPRRWYRACFESDVRCHEDFAFDHGGSPRVRLRHVRQLHTCCGLPSAAGPRRPAKSVDVFT